MAPCHLSKIIPPSLSRLDCPSSHEPGYNILLDPDNTSSTEPDDIIEPEPDINTSPAPDGTTSPEPNSITSSKQDPCLPEPGGNTLSDSDITISSEPGGTTTPEPDGNTSLEPDGTEPGGITSSEPNGTSLPKTGGNNLSDCDTDGTNLTEPVSITTPEPDGNTSPEPDGTTLTEPVSITPSEPDGTSQPRADGTNLANPASTNLSELYDITTPEADGNTSSEPCVITSFEPDGTPPKAGGTTLFDADGTNSTEPNEFKTPDSDGNKLPDPYGTISPEPGDTTPKEPDATNSAEPVEPIDPGKARPKLRNTKKVTFSDVATVKNINKVRSDTSKDLGLERPATIPIELDESSFISIDLCVALINGASVSKLQKWLPCIDAEVCDDPYVCREMLLDHVQKISEGILFPTESLVNSFLDQLKVTSIDQELTRLRINTRKKAPVNQKKALLKNHILEVADKRKSRIESGQKKISLPPLLDEENDTPSESDSSAENSSDPQSDIDYQPNTRKKAVNDKQTNDQPISSTRANVGTLSNIKSGEKTKCKKRHKATRPRNVLKKIVKNNTCKDESHRDAQGTEINREEDQKEPQFSKPQNNFDASIRVIEEKIINLEKNQTEHNTIMNTELKRQKNCIDLILNESSTKKVKKKPLSSLNFENGSLTSYQNEKNCEEISCDDSKLHSLEAKLDALLETQKSQTYTLDQLVTKFSVVKQLEATMQNRVQEFNLEIKELNDAQGLLNDTMTRNKQIIANLKKTLEERDTSMVLPPSIKKPASCVYPTKRSWSTQTDGDLTEHRISFGCTSRGTQTLEERSNFAEEENNEPTQHSIPKGSIVVAKTYAESATGHNLCNETARKTGKGPIRHEGANKKPLLSSCTGNASSIETVAIPAYEENFHVAHLQQVVTNAEENTSVSQQNSSNDNEPENEWVTQTNSRRRWPKTTFVPYNPANRSNAQSEQNTSRSTYRRKKCLVAHDSTFIGFRQEKFSRQLEVTQHLSPSVAMLSKDKKFKETIKQLNPECILIHVGAKDVNINRKTSDILRDFESLVYYLLENTEANICFSLIIPTTNNNEFIELARKINSEVEHLITSARAENSNNRACLFSYNNNSVQDHYRSTIDGFKLSEAGTLIMWKRLEDAIRKTLRIDRRQISKRQPHTNTQRSTDDE